MLLIGMDALLLVLIGILVYILELHLKDEKAFDSKHKLGLKNAPGVRQFLSCEAIAALVLFLICSVFAKYNKIFANSRPFFRIIKYTIPLDIIWLLEYGFFKLCSKHLWIRNGKYDNDRLKETKHDNHIQLIYIFLLIFIWCITTYVYYKYI